MYLDENNMPGMTFTKDAETGVYLACNQAFAEYANKEKPEGVVGLTDADIFNVDTEEFVEYSNGDDNKTFSELRRGWHFFSDIKMELADKVYDDDRDAFLKAMKRKTLMKVLEENDTFTMTYRLVEENGPIYVKMKISRMEDEHYIIMGIMNVDSELRQYLEK